MRASVWFGVAATAMAAVAGIAWAQKDDGVIRVDVNLVNILCSVRDKKNAFIANLEKGDFQMFEDGKPQVISQFSRETDLPLTIGLLVDVSKSQENLIETERRAASAFFKEMLRKKDSAFLISFGSEAELLQDLTNSPRLLQDGLDSMKPSISVGGIHPGPVPTSKQRGTIMYDAIYLAADEKLKREVGRKVIVLITDGVDYGSRVSRTEAMAAAQKADAIIYSIYYADLRNYGGGGEGDLRRMSEETGGRLFSVDRGNRLEDIFKQIQEEMRNQYSISYDSTNHTRDGGFRKIEIKTSNKDYKVQARKGYYAGN